MKKQTTVDPVCGMRVDPATAPFTLEIHMQRIPNLITIAAVALAAPLAVLADDAHHKLGATTAAAPGNATATGIVRKIDKDQGKITIQHGPIENLGMPAMTMVFRAKSPEMLENVKPGDDIQFAAERVNAAFTVTKIVPAK
jgi:Cu/Ag efflux protein CusF